MIREENSWTRLPSPAEKGEGRAHLCTRQGVIQECEGQAVVGSNGKERFGTLAPAHWGVCSRVGQSVKVAYPVRLGLQ
jgi:hypothetical protein